MGRVQTARQGDFLALMEPGPTLAPAVRAALIPLLAALLPISMIGAAAELRTLPAGLWGPRGPTGAAREAGDEQDRA